MRKLWTLVLVSVAPAMSTAAGCNCDGNATLGGPGGVGGAVMTGPGSGGAGGATAGGGVGEVCKSDGDCRTGLICDDSGTCQPGHDTDEGDPCTISDECKDGLYCDSVTGVCAQAGGGTDGDPCSSDADCGPGFRCDISGFSAVCEPEGSGDVGQDCTTNADCFAGLQCVGGMCATTPGSPWAPPTWGGVTDEECNDDPSSVVAYFAVPRSGTTQDFYRLPYPNDVRANGTTLDMTGFATPGSGFLGYDLVQRYVDGVSDDFAGFGVYESVFFRFSGQFDGDSLMNNVHMVDLTTGGGASYYYTYSYGGGNYICPNWVAMRPAQGAAFVAGHTYAAYFTTSVVAMGGAPITVSSDLTALLGATAPSDLDLAAQWPKYQSFRDYLTTNAIATSTILNASVFTVGDPTAAVTKLATDVAAAPAPTAASWTLCDGVNASPCSDATGDRACPTSPDPAFDELHALVTLPVYQTGTAPYLDPTDGGGFVLDGAGAPIQQGTVDVCMALTVPKGGAPVGGFPTVVFAHGMGGSFRTHILEGVATAFATGVDDGQGTIVKAAVLGIDQPQHGPRRNGSMLSPNDLFFNYANPAAMRGNFQQGAADQLSLARFVPSVNLPAASSPTGQDVILSTRFAFFGHSQGSSEGAVMLPTSGYAGAVLAGSGAAMMDLLVTKTTPVNVAAIVPFVLQDIDLSTGRLPGAHDPATAVDTDQNHPVLNIIQQYMDPADSISYALAVTYEPPLGVNPHPLFQVYGQDDTSSPALTMATFALAAKIGLVAADASVTTPDPIGALTTIPTPASGNLSVNGSPVSGLVREYAPPNGVDGHDVVFELPAATTDAHRFLAGILSGIQPQVGP